VVPEELETESSKDTEQFAQGKTMKPGRQQKNRTGHPQLSSRESTSADRPSEKQFQAALLATVKKLARKKMQKPP
jgi:hypothetical protein